MTGPNDLTQRMIPCLKVTGGRRPTDIDVIEWAARVERLGAGEFMPTSMDRDGPLGGCDNGLQEGDSAAVNVLIIASDIAGEMEHVASALEPGRAESVPAAYLFPGGAMRISDVKDYMHTQGIPVRRSA